MSSGIYKNITKMLSLQQKYGSSDFSDDLLTEKLQIRTVVLTGKKLRGNLYHGQKNGKKNGGSRRT